MNPKFNNYSNQELAGEVEHFANMMEAKGRKDITMSIEFMRLLAERLRMTTEADMDEALLDAANNVRQKVNAYTERLNAAVSDLENISDELSATIASLDLLED